ncbi:unnamed protein product [Caenorhabditis auriculariae]|uniref:Uncharacterized protein n=1 Tax=Caenorhabditis auriculariae TaxID=2777116 RepID=A0A8S1GUW1_9PELO|nr:unnamed protein product [Caenorhabditis auriculariae]
MLFFLFLTITLLALLIPSGQTKAIVKRQWPVNPIQAQRNQRLRMEVANLRGQLQGRNQAEAQFGRGGGGWNRGGGWGNQGGFGSQGGWNGQPGGWGGQPGGWGGQPGFGASPFFG